MRKNPNCRLQLESLEDRRVLAAVGLAAGVLSVTGDAVPDRIYITTSADGVSALVSVFDPTTLAVKANGTFTLANLTSINIVCNAGNDTVECNLDRPATIDGGYGNDTIYGGLQNDSILGGEGHDVIYGQLGHDTILGGNGNDLLYGGIGADSLDGGAGADSLYGGTGGDTLIGGADDDLLHGEGDNDFLQADAGNDSLFGDSGFDTLNGGTGYDITHGGADNDRIYTDALDQTFGDEGVDWFDGLSERGSPFVIKTRNPNSTVYKDWGLV